MGSNIIELAKLGHERAAELKGSYEAINACSVAQLISDLATQLEVQLVRGNEQAVQLANAESKCRELAAENEKWQQESQSWQAVAEKQLIAVGELEKQVSGLESREVDLPTFNIPVRWGTVMICVDMTEIKK